MHERGSELDALAVPVQALWWNGLALVANADDHCTGLPGAALTFDHWQRGLQACETSAPAGTLRLKAGRAFFTLRAPGAGNAEHHDLAVTRDYYAALPERVRKHLACPVVDELTPISQKHTIEGLVMGEA